MIKPTAEFWLDRSPKKNRSCCSCLHQEVNSSPGLQLGSFSFATVSLFCARGVALKSATCVACRDGDARSVSVRFGSISGRSGSVRFGSALSARQDAKMIPRQGVLWHAVGRANLRPHRAVRCGAVRCGAVRCTPAQTAEAARVRFGGVRFFHKVVPGKTKMRWAGFGPVSSRARPSVGGFRFGPIEFFFSR